jgi:molecular chaperone DnaK (HSP70)
MQGIRDEVAIVALQLGIDFGTTRTAVACADRGNYPVVTFTDAGGDAAPWIPTIVAERDGELRYGLDAAAVAGDPSFALVRSFKRVLGSVHGGPGQAVRVGSSEVSAAELVAGFLAHVREALMTRSDARRSLVKASTLKAAIAVPASAHGAQRLVTLDAFRRAGFEPLAMLNEPSAAGFEYTHRHRDTLSSKRDLVVVYDLGGGTFDASLVRMSGKRHEVLGTAGLPQLGGDDFDALLADLALARVGLSLGGLDARAARRVLDLCRVAKEALGTASRKVTLDLEAALGEDAPLPEVTLPVTEYYEACAPMVETTVEAMLPLMNRLGAEASSPDLAEIAGIYVVGGASELPVVARTLRERFGRRVHRSPYPAAAVAIGLSIAADTTSGFELLDRYSRTFGVFREASGGSEITFDPIFTPDTELPAVRGETLEQTRTYRAAHNVGHYRFFECSAFDDLGRPRGDMALFGDVYFPFDPRLHNARDLARIPVERRGEQGPRVTERYRLDDKGMVDVVIRDQDSGYERSYRLGRI